MEGLEFYENRKQSDNHQEFWVEIFAYGKKPIK